MPEQTPALFLIDGNSLVYRAFFALPESIATSTGEPTNAIFGFASMLVKLITDYGLTPTVVAWDAGTSGRTEIYPDYKAQRRSRPDLLREQWPAFEPLVEAFGYHNARLEGYEADDVIATLAQRAIEQRIPVAIVTGDRDAFQLVDEEGYVTVMATARGITETTRLRPRRRARALRHRPRADPRLLRAQGRHLRQHPGRPRDRREDRRRAAAARSARSRPCSTRIDEVSGAKRRENLLAHREDALVSKQLATMRRDLDAHDLAQRRARGRAGHGRAARRPSAATSCATRCGASRRRSATCPSAARAPDGAERRRGAARGGARAARRRPARSAVAVCPPAVPEGALFGEGGPWRFGVADRHARCSSATARARRSCVAALGDRAVVAHDAKALGVVPAGSRFDTMLAAYLLDPARRGYPLAELCEDRGIDPGLEDRAGWEAGAVATLAAAQRPELEERGLTALLRDVELPLVGVLRSMEQAGIALDLERLAAITARVAARRSPRSSARSTPPPGRSS